jgi:hypothetical protein
MFLISSPATHTSFAWTVAAVVPESGVVLVPEFDALRSSVHSPPAESLYSTTVIVQARAAEIVADTVADSPAPATL